MTPPREELERLVQLVDRQHPDWSSRAVERELETLASVTYGRWKDETPKLAARLRQVQRWRKGYRNPPKPPASALFTYLWPIGERQRREIEPTFEARPTRLRASHRLFLYNCSGEPIRELQVRLDGRGVAYEPVIPVGKFVEINWYRDGAIRAVLLAASDHDRLRCRLSVEFAVDKGRKRGRLQGELVLDASDGWVSFASDYGPEKEIE